MDAKASTAISIGERSSSRGERGVTKRLQALESLTPIGGHRLLDIGCGDGTYTRRLAGWFTTVDAVDVEPERLTLFRHALRDSPFEGRVTVRHLSADALDYADATFDAVTTIEVLEHVGDLDGSLREIHRVLKPDGRLLLTSPNAWFPLETHGPLVRGRRLPTWSLPGLPWASPLHQRWSDARTFTVRGLTKRCREVGLQRVGYTFIMPPFDRSRVGRVVRPVTDALEHTPLGHLGMALVMVFEPVQADRIS